MNINNIIKKFLIKNDSKKEMKMKQSMDNTINTVSVNKYLKKQINNEIGIDQNEYVFIDFETANNEKTSACQIALVKVKQDKIIKKYNSLIKPYPFLFTNLNIGIHKINNKTVQNAKNFKELWSEIQDFFTEETIVIAHQASFDINVLRELIRYYKIVCPNFYYICSVSLFRKTQTYHKNTLKFLADSNQISFQHHDALADVNI